MKLEELKLPEHLQERTRFPRKVESSVHDGEFVLYWMCTAVRSDENPALDVAVLVAKHLNQPLLVYHSISQRYQYASDRHHTFMLEGAQDVAAQLKALKISYAFHLETPDDEHPYLLDLARRSSLIVAEEMPVNPPRRFLNAVIKKTETPILCVDTACVVPMLLTGRAFTRAFQYRDATKQLYQQRITRSWPSNDVEPKPFDLTSLPFEPFDFQNNKLSDWVARCEIDHSIGPVVDTQGGSSNGYDRWSRFMEHGLSKYAGRRNNALVDGVSRMSAYLHYGMVSPMKLARDAGSQRNTGSEKYLDELLIWRELAYSYCFHIGTFQPWSVIPEWAKATLVKHTSDQREMTFCWEQLARGKTGDALWDAAQTSLIRHGELHNNVRMTWGKAILQWLDSPQQALELMVDLNHRYALDGRDPASYGGLLWCLGQFDRPFEPEKKIFGTVRPRSTQEHAKRLDPMAYQRKVSRTRVEHLPRIGVIGAGISGLFAARTLVDHGLPVTVFDKGRGIGGRMSTRRVDGQPAFDHGAQYFTARDPRFQKYVDSWIQQGVVKPWPITTGTTRQNFVVFTAGKKTDKTDQTARFVGAPAMNAVCKHLASELTVRTSTRIEVVKPIDNQLHLITDQDDCVGEFDMLVVSAPAEQTAELLQLFPKLSEPISKVQMQPCWAVMASFDRPIGDDWAGAFIHDAFISWVARNSTKPGRPGDRENVVIHASPDWTDIHWESDPDEVAQKIINELWRSLGVPAQDPVHLQAHRWKYAIPTNPSSNRCFFDDTIGIAACGDWAGGPRVEGAFLSGMAAAGRILGTLKPRKSNQVAQMELF